MTELDAVLDLASSAIKQLPALCMMPYDVGGLSFASYSFPGCGSSYLHVQVSPWEISSSGKSMRWAFIATTDAASYAAIAAFLDRAHQKRFSVVRRELAMLASIARTSGC